MKKEIILLVVIVGLIIAGGVFMFSGNNVGEKTGKEAPEKIEQMDVKLFYYNFEKDKEPGIGMVLCSADAVLPVQRTVPVTVTPIKDTLELLLKGQLTEAEKSDSFSTEFPLSGVSLRSVNLKSDGTLIIELNDPENKTTGGSCRVNILAAQVTKTAMQFPSVKRVSFTPEHVFQP